MTNRVYLTPPQTYKVGDRIRMLDNTMFGSIIPVGTLGTVTYPMTAGGNVEVKWDDFTDLNGDFISDSGPSKEAEGWMMDPREIEKVVQ